ncbi:RidA family protein [Crassaminicella indica]|uniref:RidA family protein n=1 Tax=Crassaminicella indica TaxID=2855394 RepID=A0ABX8RDL4_9CLOT|nr:RidA family protein [Crassaminicella indica]QXM06542.1 RidA family protein [Crassaminicella indica]
MKKIINTEKAPQAIGPYSQGTIGSKLIFVSGQLPIDPNTGEFADGGIEGQTRQSIENLRQILESVGSGLDKVLKTTVFLSDMNNFAKMNKVYEELFGDSNYPARSAIEVARLPKDALVEIEAIAIEG